MEQENVVETPQIEPSTPVEAVVPDGGTPAPVETKNWEVEYNRINPEYEKYQKYIGQLSEYVDRDPSLQEHIAKVARGEKWSVAPPEPKPVEKPVSPSIPPEYADTLKRIPDLEARIKTYEQKVELQEIQGTISREMEEISKEYPFMKDEKEQERFLKDVNERVKQEAANIRMDNPAISRDQAFERATRRYNSYLPSTFVMLRKKEIGDYLRSQGQDALPAGIATPADKIGKPGQMPGIQERYKSALENESDPEKRAQMRIEYAKAKGISPDELFASGKI